ncbi:O-methyltransferase [Kordia sp.]|uniref:O-methyltransferase n=1 Tax=Kordia sp. TaxID=1965332 RepID=UPI003B5C89D6
MQTITRQTQIEIVLNELFKDSKNDYLKMVKGMAKSVFRPLQPIDFKEAYLSISKQQGEALKQLIQDHNFTHIVEFGTSFGISTLFLAQGIIETNGHIITTELIESKAQKAIKNFTKAGVNEHIQVKIGNAMETLKHHNSPIDLLLLDGWKDLYLPLFQLLEPNFHKDTIVYVDNADMSEVQSFLATIRQNEQYQLEAKHQGKVVLIRKK